MGVRTRNVKLPQIFGDFEEVLDGIEDAVEEATGADVELDGN